MSGDDDDRAGTPAGAAHRGKGGGGPPLIAKIDISDANLVEKVANLLTELTHRLGLTNDQLAHELGWERKRIKSIRYAPTQGTRYVALSDVRTILRYGRDVAERTEDDDDCRALMQDCNDISNSIWEFLESGGLSATEHAFVSHLQLNPREQRDFSDKMAGVYANIRFDREGRVAIARMDIYPKEPRGILCRFRTSKVAAFVEAEQVISGYIYQSGATIHALGRPEGVSTLRSTILRFAEMSEDHRLDMVGLRLSDSALDSGPFSSRLYCRRIGGPEVVEAELPEWDRILRAVTPNKAHLLKVSPLIPDIAEIMTLLREPDPRLLAWGLALPRGVDAGDEGGGK